MAFEQVIEMIKTDTRKWAIVETYYKHGEYALIIIESSSELRAYLDDKLEDYEDDSDSEEDSDDDDLEKLIAKVEYLGNERVDNQRGWGVREIREI